MIPSSGRQAAAHVAFAFLAPLAPLAINANLAILSQALSCGAIPSIPHQLPVSNDETQDGAHRD